VKNCIERENWGPHLHLLNRRGVRKQKKRGEGGRLTRKHYRLVWEERDEGRVFGGSISTKRMMGLGSLRTRVQQGGVVRVSRIT